MAEYIEREALWRAFEFEPFYDNADRDEIVLPKIDDFPAADVAPVVRCKDCVHFVYDELDDSSWCCRDREVETPELHFCSYGERKDGDGNG